MYDPWRWVNLIVWRMRSKMQVYRAAYEYRVYAPIAWAIMALCYGGISHELDGGCMWLYYAGKHHAVHITEWQYNALDTHMGKMAIWNK